MTHVVYSTEELSCFYVVDKKGKRIRPRQVKKSKRSRPHWDDSIRDGVLTPRADGMVSPPGSGRVADLVSFYDANAASEVSPFSFEFD